ncbi:MAG: MBG domain-containing protein, partial [Verrucomicrobiota bacterium]
ARGGACFHRNGVKISLDSSTVTATVILGPAITSQPVSVSINRGASATFSVSASGASPTYQWYVGNAGVITNPITDATSNSLTTAALTSTTSYWVRVSNAAGSVDSSTVTATVITPPAITSQPVSVSIISGATASFSVTTSGTSPTFQWYIGSSGVITNPVGGATTNSLTTTALTSTTSYWVRVSNSAGTVDSTTAIATVNTPPLITSQPASIEILKQSTITLTVVATGSATLGYQWYSGISPTTSSVISGATSASYTPGKFTQAGTFNYWVRVTNLYGIANSSTATVTVDATAIRPVITSQPVSTTIVTGNTATLSVVASGTSPTFQWYVGNSGVITNQITGATGSSFTTPALTTTTSYWVRATNSAGSADSNTATVTVQTKATATLTLGNLAATYDGTAKSATATTTPSGLSVSYTYQGSSTAPTNVGTYAVVATINDTNYQGSANGTLVISKATATLTLGSLAATYNGTAKSATSTTTPSGLSVSYTYQGSSTAPTNVGTYAVVATINDANYQGSGSGSLVIAPAPPSFANWAANHEISNGLTAGTISNYPSEDFDQDGRSNLIEYAFGMSPVSANDPTPRMPITSITPTHFVLRYQCDTTLTDVSFTAQTCTTLGNWLAPGDAGAPSGFTDTVVATSGSLQTHEAKLPRSTSANGFMRLRITQY